MTVAFDDDTDVTLEVAFASDPKDASPSWTDVSAYMRAFSIRQGRSFERDTVGPSQLSVTLSNDDRRFDPTFAAGAYDPDVIPTKPIRLQAVHNSITYDLFRGTVDGWPQLWPGHGKDAVTVIEATDDFKLLAMDALVSTESQEKSGVRIGNMLDDVSWPAGRRSLATGIMDVVAGTVECVNPLTEIQKVVDSELGLFFMDGAGDAVFQDKNLRSGLGISAIFGPANLAYENVVVTYDDTQIWNNIVGTRSGVTAPVAVEDAGSVTAHGRRRLRLNDLLLVDNTDLTTTVNAYLTRYKDPGVRVSSMMFNPRSDQANLWPEALGVTMSDKYTVKVVPPGGGADISQDVHVESMSHTVDAATKTWSVAWQLSPA